VITLSQLNLESISPEELGEILISAKKAYYTTDKPIMDDHTYDTLEEILKQKSPHHRLFSKVGTSDFNTGFNKKKHLIPMGSQNKVSKYEDLVHYFELKKFSPLLVKGEGGGGFIVQPKCDGISLEIEYSNGKLVDAITRGNGFVGDIITQNVVKMKNFVLSPPNHFSGSIRCEIVVTKNDFEKLNQVSKKVPISQGGNPEGEGVYSNPRNAASGLSQRLDGKYSEFCTLIAVDILTDNGDRSEQDKILSLKSLGFTPVESILCHSFDEIEKIYQSFLKKDRQDYPYEIDGLVIKINDINISRQLGSKNNRPKSQVAYKFPADSNQSQIKKITWQVGPMGSITPVAEVEPIELSGAVVSFASLGNYDLVIKKNLNIGDVIEISRRGDVIPHIEKIITKVFPGHVDIPLNCPHCQAPLCKKDKQLHCPNSQNCLPQILGSLRLFCNTLDILGLSEKTIEKLYQANKIRVPGDFYKLKIEDISQLDNLGEKSAKNIIHQIQSKKSLSLKQVFDAAIIPNFSAARVQQLITNGYDTPQKIINISQSELESLPGFQKTLANKVWQGIQLRKKWIESILSQIVLKDHSSKALKLSSLSFAITGSLSQPRQTYIDLIESLGGKISSSISQNTNYLLTNDTSSKSSKFLSAQKLNVKIINEDQFNQLISSR